MKYSIGPYPNDIIAVAPHLPPEGRCLAVALTAVIVVPLDGKATDPLARKDVLKALEEVKRQAEAKLTDRAFEVSRGEFILACIDLDSGEETVTDVKLELPNFQTGEEIQ